MQNDKSSDAKNSIKFLVAAEDKYPPFRVDVKVLFAEEMTAKGHDVDWLLQSEDSCRQPYATEWSGCRVYVGATNLGSTRLSRVDKHLKGLANDFRMFGLASKNGYDVIQIKDKILSALLAIIAARKNGSKFTYWLSYPFPEASIYEAKTGVARFPFLYYIRGVVFKFLLYRVIARWADHFFVQSEQMKRDVIKEGVSPEKLTAVPMGISEEMFSKLASVNTENVNLGKASIVYLGTLLKTRKLEFAIKVLKEVLLKEPEAMLYMVGPEEQEGDIAVLKQEAISLGVEDKVIFTGRLPQHEALAYVSSAAVCISPFFPTPILNSTSPTKLIEYMAFKKAVVANDHPEQSLVITASGGGLCVPYDVNDFAGAIVKILSNPDMAKDMGAKGYDYVMKHRTYDKLSDLINNVYLGLVSDRS